MTLERTGIPTAVLCSDEFGPLGRAEAQVLGLGALPLVPIPHPLAGNDAARVRAKACAVADAAWRALTSPAAEVEARHRHTFLALTERRLEGGAVCVDDVCAVDPSLGASST
ncbi:MAG: hypothetical protein AB7O21_15965 [Gammaproteobacteria bacterium]